MVQVNFCGKGYGGVCSLWGMERVLECHVSVLCFGVHCFGGEYVSVLSMVFVVTCLRRDCMECDFVSALREGLCVFCGHWIMAYVLFLFWV